MVVFTGLVWTSYAISSVLPNIALISSVSWNLSII
jgi:hypothetical protein